jgi:UDP-galactopyranose mutase
MSNSYNALIVGAGLTGATIARRLAEAGYSVLVIDLRDVIGGNIYDEVDCGGILVTRYGPHIFHTSNDRVIGWVKKFHEWRDYTLVQGAHILGVTGPAPANFVTIDQHYSIEDAAQIKADLISAFPDTQSITITQALNSSVPTINAFANMLWEHNFKPYLVKQWGRDPDSIDPTIVGRAPIKLSYDQRRFEDTFEALPTGGYTKFVESLLNHSNIQVRLSVDSETFSVNGNETTLDGEAFRNTVVYTGPIDRLFGEIYGRLPYRSLRFRYETKPFRSFQEYPVIVFPEAEGYTRITEYSKLPYQDKPMTTIAYEYPIEYDAITNEPYYPIVTDESDELYSKYVLESQRYPNLILAGRLAKFQYLDMDKCIYLALVQSDEIVSRLDQQTSSAS